MKRFYTFWTLALVTLLFVFVDQSQANDYLELQKHYMVYTSGANKIHFKIPVWAYGRAFNYYLYNSSASYILLTKDASGKTVESAPTIICSFESEAYGENANKNTQKGTAWMSIWQGKGTAVVTSMYNGTTLPIHDTGTKEFAMVKQVEDDDCPYVSILEFDWYPPESLDEQEFAIVLNLNIYKSYTGNLYDEKEFRFSGPFSGSNNLMAPQLSEPYLYTVNATGVTGYGQAAVQYTTFQNPIFYATSNAPNDMVTITDRAGTIYVNTTDTVQEQFTATFKVYRDEALQTTSFLTAPPVDIPPFHRIYDFQAMEQADSLGSLTGNNVLHWSIKNPALKDLVENDYFEIQRATKGDFSDAQTIDVINMRRDENGEYTYEDDTYKTQVNTATNTQTDTLRRYLSANLDGYVLRDAGGQPMCELDLELWASDFILPSAPVYYRIRRAASSLWGWEHEFAMTDTVFKHNYLAPLAATQTNYIKDAAFATNHTVHFDIRLDNMEIGYRPISLDRCGFTFRRGRTLSDTVAYTVKYDERSLSYTGYYDGDEPAIIFVYATHEGEELFGAMPGMRLPGYEATVRVPRGSIITTTVRPTGPYSYRDTISTFTINDHTTTSCRFRTMGNMYLQWDNALTYASSANSSVMPEELVRIQEIQTAIKQAVLPALQEKNESYGKCIWDRTARLLLCRTNQETGQTVEIVVPQDSIRRQADGSWLAHMTDVAGEPCTHYTYSARIDQSDASIHVSDDVYLQPVAIYGDDLYFDESATITSFTASQGATEGYRKTGISLSWTASSMAVDEYVLTRIAKNSDQVPDTLLRTIDTNYFDESVQPNVHYEYTITALYDCNGKHSSNAATAEGWRTPYGQISGAVLMPDNSGMAGVQVSLSADGQTIKTITTDATGTYLFDSLSYDLTSGTIYTVTPTSQYGVFSYNNTSSGAASVSIAADHATVSGVQFVNTSSVRLSGRVLYSGSTIPVAGVSFILNGDTLRRNGGLLLSGIDGSFELTVPKSQMHRLQVAKQGHTFDNDGWLFVTGTDTAFSLVKALDGVRLYDATKVRLVGRVAGGNDQRDLPHGFGLGKNNLGDDVQLVLMLEGDNTAHIVHDPDDLSRDTLHRAVGTTDILLEQKRITIHPDPNTGEYAADLFPVKYKVVQATAKGYATLFAAGTGSETFDLTNAPLSLMSDSLNGSSVSYNAVYDRIYHNPVQVSLTQLNYGMEADGLGEAKMQASCLNPQMDSPIALYTKQADGTIDYLLGYPIFTYNRRYQFMAAAYEEYRYNNEPSGTIDRVPQRGGTIVVQNGMSVSTDRQSYILDSLGRNKGVWLTVDKLDMQSSGTHALRTVSVALQSEGNTVEATAFQAFVEGSDIQPDQLQTVDADISLLDIIRDPGGNGSSAYVESGTTYKFAYVENYHWKVGVNIDLSWSAGITQDIGIVTAPNGGGSYIGATYSTKRELALTLPIVHEWKWGYKYDYTITTNDRISTSSAKGSVGVGAKADVFLGVTTSQLAGKAKTIALINDSLFEARQPAIQAGTMKVLSQGTDTAGNTYYLVTGEKVVMGSRISHTFAYSQAYIMQTIIPSYILQRQNMLMNFNSLAEAKAMANATGEPVYWNMRTVPVDMQSTLAAKDYKMVLPDGNKAFVDEVKALDNMIMKWTTILYNNEREKIIARSSGQKLGTWSVNFGNTYTHSDSYSAMYNYNAMPNGWDLAFAEAQIAGTDILTDLLQSITNTSSNFLKGITKNNPIGTSVEKAIKQYYEDNDSNKDEKPKSALGTKTNNSEFDYDFSPVVSYDCDDNLSQELTQKKTAGFTLAADDQGAITVSVYRANMDSVWRKGTEYVRSNAGAADMLYGSYVFFTEAGSTFCPYEPEERTMLYNAGSILNRATEYVAKPELSIDTYEQTNVPSDQRAIFRIEMKNHGQVQTGHGASGMAFNLALVGASNPDGAKLYINGAALARPISYFIKPGETVSQVLEVEKGLADDYENLQLVFGTADCPKTNTTISLSVHFMPESSPVQVAFPRDKWVMNTLSARDSIGYYLPVTIDGFNIHHKNFDHIEFQYKLSTENNDAWVNQCSFYADDSLYDAATGNKAMIENGRITPFRFYGERDPKELRYDLRAVSYCRYGSGFVSKASPVISGTKDTRPPVLFGKANPSNGILTPENNISLRFSEPIAGNWLDEDNNFQLLGVTNATGITQTTSLYFDGQAGHYAYTQAKRELAITDLTIDMLIKPAEKGREMTLLAHGDEAYNFTLSLTADNRLKLTAIDDGKLRESKLSKPMGELSTTDFTRVVMVHNFFDQTIRFYAGTLDITDDPSTNWLLQNSASVFTVGAGLDSTNCYHGNIMEVRVWTKPLTPAEISNTHMRRLTGYEHDLQDYYPMNEGKGKELTDPASGATLYTKGLSWTNPQGLSVALDGEGIRLRPEYFSRTAAEDYTFTGWYRSDNKPEDGFTLLSTSLGDSLTMSLSYAAEQLFFRQGDVNQGSTAAIADGQWHHIALTVSKSYNTGSLYLDGRMVQTFPVTSLDGLSGTTLSVGDGLKGNIDDICLFEQALPASLVEEVMHATPNGDEMGLIALLTFSEMKRNASNILEQVFSPNDQRVFRDANGNVVNKVVPLIVSSQQKAVNSQADKSNYAPVADRGQLTNLNFTWTYHDEELLISLNMQDREINKRTIYMTVRDVEDLNGNRLLSPISWSVYADLNSLRWEARKVEEQITDPSKDYTFKTGIYNTTGMTRQYTIDNLPEWLDAQPKQGTLTAKDEAAITFTVKKGLTPGQHNAVVYLTDDRGLSESLVIDVEVISECPWDNIDAAKYKQNMSLRAQVIIDTDGTEVIDTDTEDIVGIFCNGELLGKGQVQSDDNTRGYVYITVYGDASLNGRLLTARLWRHSTAKTHVLLADTTLKFRESACFGCPPAEPVHLRTSNAMIQSVNLDAGWTWTSFYIKPDRNGIINNVLMADPAFDANDEMKSPATGNFCRYDDATMLWKGSLTQFSYRYIHMFFTQKEHTISVSGTALQTDEDRTIPLRKGWNVLPYLQLGNKNLRDALAGYYAYAQEGDLVKSHDEFAVFSANGKWEGNLTYMQPGRGYLLYRNSSTPVTFTYPVSSETNAPVRVQAFRNPNAATNMTIIATLDGEWSNAETALNGEIRAYINDELVGVASPATVDGESLYFLTIQSDLNGELRFEATDGTELTPLSSAGASPLLNSPLKYAADTHYGSLKAPIVLTPGDIARPYKIIEDDRVIIIRDGERYDVTGVKLDK